MMHRPLILITNDDGVFSPGLRAAAAAAAAFGDLLIAAPRFQQTGMSRSLTGGSTAGVIEEQTLAVAGQEYPAYGIHASPAMCVVHAVLELAPRPPDLCISGVNYGENIGRTISASGTVGAALEASAFGIPALAVSRGAPLHLHRADSFDPLDWTAAQQVIQRFVPALLASRLPAGVDALNINVPDSASDQTEIRFTTQSRQAHIYFARPGQRPLAEPYQLPLGQADDAAALEADSDIRAFVYDRVISVTPLTAQLNAAVSLAALAQHYAQTM
jgi:5'-nucleotidase